MIQQDDDISYAEYYNLNTSEYEDVPVTKLPFSTRAINRFMGNGIVNVSDMLVSTPAQLTGLKGFGKNCLDEVEKFCRSIQTDELIIEKKASHENIILPIISANKDMIALGDFSFAETAVLTEEETDAIYEYQHAYSVIGDELAFDCIASPEKVLPVIKMFDDFNTKMKSYRELQDMVRAIPILRRNNKAEWYIKAFTIDDNERKLLSSYCNTKDCLIINMVAGFNQNDIKDLTLLKKFLKWCLFDLSDEISRIFKKVYANERAKQVISLRASGQTLEQVGKSLGVTRERIRQIEAKARRGFAYAYSRLRVVSKIAAERNGDTILTPEEIRGFCSTDANVFLYLLKGYENANYTYDKQLDVFIVGDDSLRDRIDSFIDTLPEIINVDHYQELLSDAEDETSIPREMLEKAFFDNYQNTGSVYHRSRLSLSTIYQKILEQHFSSGMHVYDEIQLNQFRDYVLEDFGEIKLPENNRALTARISGIGILCGRGMYRVKQKQYISKHLSDRIYKYIVESDQTVFLAGSIYNVFEDELAAEGIDNRYYLQGVMHEIFADKFFFRRDYISKDPGITSIYSAIVDYIRQSKYPVTKAQIKNKFPGITDIVITLSVEDPDVLNYFGQYFHADRLSISNSEREYLSKTIKNVLDDKCAHHIKDIDSIIRNEKSEILTRNAVMIPFCTYSIIEHLFREKYQFSRPYIAQIGTAIDRPGDRLHEMIYESDMIYISDIRDFAKENHLQIQSILDYVNACNDQFLLIDSNTLMKMELIGITYTEIKEIENLILSEISATTPINHLTIWHRLPSISVAWNEWLLYSALNKWGSLLSVGTSSNQMKMAIPLVAPFGELQIDTDMYTLVNKHSTIQIDDLDNIDDLIADMIGDDILEEIL